MNLEKGLVYSFSFKATGRVEAARIAHDLAISKGQNKKTALKQSVRAFLGRPVSVAAEELQNRNLAYIGKQLTECHQKKLLNRVSSLTGVDPIRWRGKSKSLARQAVVRTWPYKGIRHPGHATLSIKDSSPGRKKPKHVYFSWWPNKPINTRLNKLLDKLGLYELSTKTARNVSRYKWDKRDEISFLTQARLVSGAGNHDELEKHGEWFTEEEKEMAKKKPLKPRARQVQIRGTRLWGMQADKVYLPMIGPNTDIETEKETFSVFGLNEAKMERFTQAQAKAAKEGKATYDMGSGANSCSGMILRALKEGGAGHYIKTNDAWFVSDPNMIHAMAIRLQKRVDKLNRRAEGLSLTFNEQLEKMKQQGALKPEATGVPKHLGVIDNWNAAQFPKLPPEMARKIDALKAAIKKFEGAEITLDKLVPLTIKLVETLDSACTKAGDDELSKMALMPALGAFEKIKEYLSQAHFAEQANREGPPSIITP